MGGYFIISPLPTPILDLVFIFSFKPKTPIATLTHNHPAYPIRLFNFHPRVLLPYRLWYLAGCIVRYTGRARSLCDLRSSLLVTSVTRVLLRAAVAGVCRRTYVVMPIRLYREGASRKQDAVNEDHQAIR